MNKKIDPKPNFKYPRIGAKIKIPGAGFDPDRFGYYVGKNKSGQLILNMDLKNLLPDQKDDPKKIERKMLLLNVYDNFEVMS